MRQMLAALFIVAAFQNQARGESSLQEGAYDVEVTLELPHVSDTSTRKIERLCLGRDWSTTLGLVVLSSNNPLGHCPVSNARLSINTLSFDVTCAGLNAATGHALYEIMPEHFRGRIEMKMGGKNMTMTEIQVGHRIGSCDMLRTH